MRVPPLGLAAAALLLLAPALARSEPQNGGAAVSLFHAGIRVPLAIAPQPDSGALVVSADTRNGFIDFYAQRLDRHGRPQLGEGGALVLTGIGTSLYGNAIADGSGGIVFTWTQVNASSGSDVYVQRVLANGTVAYGAGGLVVCNAAYDQVYPILVPGPSGSYYVTWTDQRANVSNQADIYVQRLTVAGGAVFTANGLPVNTVAYRSASYSSPNLAPDLSGGLLLSWTVYSPSGIRAQRMSSAGALLYGATGAPLADPSDYSAPIAGDGSGGLWAFTTRSSGGYYTPYAHHLTSSGASTFPTTGIAIHSSVSGYFNLSMVRNATSGCFFVGTYYYSSSSTIHYTLFRQEVTLAGTLPRGTDGEVLSGNNYYFSLMDAGTCALLVVLDDETGYNTLHTRLQKYAFDGTGAYPGVGLLLGRARTLQNTTAAAMNVNASGMVFETHADGRYSSPANPFDFELFGQAFDGAGNPLWDDAENPVLQQAQDAPGDQGGQVRLAWDRSAADAPSAHALTGYRGWRALGAAPAARLAPLLRTARPDDVVRVEGSRFVLHASQYWEMVAQAPAAQLANYALTVPTGQDSSASGAANESFMVEAYDDSLHHWWSNVLAAHSVDNLAPAPPAPFTGNYASGATYLYWNANGEADLAGYRLYRGPTTGFTPDAAHLIASPATTGWTDLVSGAHMYQLVAVDTHGNASAPAIVIPAGLTAVDGAPPAALAFALASVSPAHGAVALRLALPAAARVRVTVVDAAGRLVRTLADGERGAGAWTLAWDGADASGRAAPSGLYFARLAGDAGERSVRLVLVH